MTTKPSPQVIQFRRENRPRVIEILDELQQLVREAEIDGDLAHPDPNGEHNKLVTVRTIIINGFSGVGMRS